MAQFQFRAGGNGNANGHGNGNGNGRGRPSSRGPSSRGRRQRDEPRFTFRYPPPPPTAERPLLSTKREKTPELLQPEDGNPKPALKFASLKDLSDSEEAEMDFSDDSEDEGPARKKRVQEVSAAGDGSSSTTPLLIQQTTKPTPKWSNPDPYTALPPPNETTHKKFDVVKMIRKAKIANEEKKHQNAAVADNQDFISLAMPGELSEKESEPKVPENAPKAPKSWDKEIPTGPRGMETRGAAARLNYEEQQREQQRARARAPENAPSGPRTSELSASAALNQGTKRTRDDQVKNFTLKSGKPIRRFNADGSTLEYWRPLQGQDPAPWLSAIPNSSFANTSLLLDAEINAFYDWVKPQYFEQAVRLDLVNRLESGFQRRFGRVAVRPFGSFASGLYLPVADIDLVLLSMPFQQFGQRSFGLKPSAIYKLSANLRDMDIVHPGSIETIAHARVPILKFVDNLTGLRVDLSFDNDSGLLANETFQVWKREYPIMPMIVSVIKQFLLIRGLNEVPTGGLGGFSITCLVVSLLQHSPKQDHGDAGTILLNFFNFYGNKFNLRDISISMNPPGFANKRHHYNDRNGDRLSIMDPNNPDNDISGGTKEIRTIFRAFSDAHRALMRLHYSAPSRGGMLSSIIAANFTEFIDQRYQLLKVFESAPQFAQFQQPPPPPQTPSEASPPPPPPMG